VYKTQLSTLQRELHAHKEQTISYEKQLESLQNLKDELNSQITILNEELNKTTSLSKRCSILESEKLQLVQLNSGNFNQL
jgi:chromosome segregation ATPase